MIIETPLDRYIEEIRKKMFEADLLAKVKNMEMEYLYLQLHLCIEKSELYKSKGDTVKELLWNFYDDTITDMVEKLKLERDAAHDLSRKYNLEMIELLTESIKRI